MQEVFLPAATLPLRAEQVLRILLRYLGKNRYCWPSRDVLAKEIGVSVPTVSRWLTVLSQAGKVEIDRTGRHNRYWIPPRPDALRPVENDPSGASLLMRQTDQNRCARRIKNDAPDGSKMMRQVETPLDENESRKQQQEGEPAAAELRSKNQGDEIMQALQELGLPACAAGAAESDLGLAAAVLEHCRWRFGPGSRLRPIANKPGYLVRCVREPLAVGFTRGEDGLWQTPEGQPPRLQAGKGFGDRLAAQQAARDAQRAENERRLDQETRRLKWWQDLSDERRQRAVAIGRDKYPLWAAKGLASPTFVGLCITIAEEFEHGE